jgi:hypothetical protein
MTKEAGSVSLRSRVRSLRLENLEDRSLMAGLDWSAWLGKGAGANLASAAALVDDSYEQNDTRATAKNLGTLTTSTTIGNLVQADANDWYRFTTTARGTTSSNVSLAFTHAQGDLDLELYNSFGQRLKISQGVTNGETVSLSGLAAGTYFARVYGYRGVTNPSYSLTINPGSTVTPPAPTDDAYEENDSLATAANLGTLTANASLSNLVMADANDWFRFETTATGGSADVISLGFQNTQGNLALQLVNASGTVLASSNGTGNTESVSLAGRAAGTYYARVYSATGATNPAYSLQIVAPVAPTTPPGTSAFDIQIVYSGFTTSQRAIFEQAAARWESIIVGDLPNATYNGIAVDDLLINASSTAIDGVGGVLGQAGYDRTRTSGTRLPYHGSMQFDSADMASMEANGSLLNVIVHEIGHVLGIGTLWQSRGLLTGAGTSNPQYIGTQAVAAYNAIFGTTATGIPVENTGGSGTRDSHWRETTFQNEIMTGYINSGTNPLSRITVGALADLGYTVNFAAADNYSRPGSSSSLVAGGTRSGSQASVQYSEPRSVLPTNLGQNLAAWAGFISRRSLDSLKHAIEAIASATARSHQAGSPVVTETTSALDLLLAGETAFGGEGADW